MIGCYVAERKIQKFIRYWLFFFLPDEHGGRGLYISTDYVFDGTAPPYKTDDKPNPVNLYGQLKLEGEQSVLKVNEGKWRK